MLFANFGMKAAQPVLCWALFYCLLPVSSAQLVVNMKNKGGEILREKIEGYTGNDTVVLEYQNSDGTLVTQLIDFRNELQIFRAIILGEEELGQNRAQTLCFMLRFVKNDFITSDAMSKLRQKNPSAIRNPEEDKGVEMLNMDLQVNYDRAHVFSPFYAETCKQAKHSTYAQDSDLKVLSRTLSKDYNVLLGATKKLPVDKSISCSVVGSFTQSCTCRYEICIGWYPCGLKYCHGKDSSGKTVSYRCGIKTCRKCRVFDYFVRQKSECVWDQPD